MFFSRLFENFSLTSYFFKNAQEIQKWLVFVRKKQNLLIKKVLLQFEQFSVPRLYLNLKFNYFELKEMFGDFFKF